MGPPGQAHAYAHRLLDPIVLLIEVHVTTSKVSPQHFESSRVLFYNSSFQSLRFPRVALSVFAVILLKHLKNQVDSAGLEHLSIIIRSKIIHSIGYVGR